MYRITLTAEDRRAIDWVGGRDWTGYDLYARLWVRSEQDEAGEMEWDGHGEMTCVVREYIAWEIHDKWENNGCTIPHFAPSLASKLQRFIDSIV
jgi:hypothetical protein